MAEVGSLAVIDLETTGLPGDEASELLEIGAVLLDPGRESAGVIHSLVRPSRPLPPVVARLTGLTDADVFDAPPVEALRAGLQAALGGRTLIAHNADFERHFLSRSVGPALGDARYLDTLDLLALTHPDAPDMRLESFTRALLGSEERHRALEDALDTARVLARVATGSRRGEARYAVARTGLQGYAGDSPWLRLLGKEEQPGEEAGSPDFVQVGETREPPVPFDEDAIAAALADEARGRRHFAGYRVREEQIRLARRFVRNFDRREVALLEGGTGVGKSLAYLAAAIPFALERAAGGEHDPVVISTRTKLLQDQLVHKDIAAAARFLGLPQLRALSIKGRSNYVCERRLTQVLQEGHEPRIFAEDRMAWAALWSCARTRRYGEVGTLPAALLRRYPPLHDLRRRSVAMRAEQCTREQCARHPECAFGRRRRALGRAHLVVANHDLLLRWPPDYPALHHVVVDEVHELADVADDVYAVEVRPDAVLERIDDLFGRPGARARAPALLASGVRRALARDASHWRRAIHQDLGALGRTVGEAVPYSDAEVENLAPAVHEAGASLADGLAERLEQLAAAVDEATRDDDDASPATERAVADLSEAADALRRGFRETGDEPAVAAFEQLIPPFDRWRLVIRPVSPARAFHAGFLDKLESFAGVSASVFVAGDEFAALGELEIAGSGGAPVTRDTVPSPFPYASNMRVLALPPVTDPVGETVEIVAHLASRLRGRTLALFTSLARMDQAASELVPRMRAEGLDVLLPRRATDDPSALVERFAAGDAVLLGARRFWQGVDIPGDALQAVVIEKLPFQRPTRLIERRRQRLAGRGVDAFGRYQLGKMLLALKQMAGRLIRSESDRGLVVIVDARSDRRYFARLAEALPPGTAITLGTRADVDRLLDEVGIGRT